MSALEVTSPRLRESWNDLTMPPPEEVRPDLWSIPVPIPDNPLRYVITYALLSDSGVAVIDPGWNTAAAWDALESGLAAAGVNMADVTSVLVTHIHPDHYGLAGRVRDASGATIGIHADDAALIPGRYGADMDAVLTAMRDLMRVNGVPARDIEELSEASLGMRDFVDAALPDVLLSDGQRIDVGKQVLRVVHTPGHSPGHVCFYDEKRRLLLSGDHILPRISPNISFHVQARVNPLADFLDSLRKVRDLDVDEVLPAHEWRFRPLQPRIDELLHHHEVRLDDALQVMASRDAQTCWEITTQLEWSRGFNQLGAFMRRAAMGETLAHLVMLQERGLVQHSADEPQRWSVTPAGAERSRQSHTVA